MWNALICCSNFRQRNQLLSKSLVSYVEGTYVLTAMMLSRRSVMLTTAGVAAAGAGVTTADSGIQGSVEGETDVQTEQALTVTDVGIAGDTDAEFARVSDDNRSFQAAVELNNGDEVQFSPTVQNSAADKLSAQIAVKTSDVIDVAVGYENDPTEGPGTDNDANVDDANAADGAVKTDKGVFVMKIPGGETGTIRINAELDDTADPGAYNIGVDINPLSSEE
jgi:hypothetical protein